MQENTRFLPLRVFIAILSFGITISLIGQAAAGQTAIEHTARAGEDSLYHKFYKTEDVPVFPGGFENLTGIDLIRRESFDEDLKKALTSYKNIRFSVAPIKEDSLITIDRTVTEFVYEEKDPVDTMGWPFLIMDKLKIDNYVRLIMTFTVKDSSTGKILWKEDLSYRVTKHKMSPREGLELAVKAINKKFLRKCFSRPIK